MMPFACRYDDINPMRRELGGMTKLGRKLENPYSVKNMKRALENIKASNANFRTDYEDFEIEATHLYVRFEPKTEDELDFIEADSTMELYDYPLDHEILVDGDYYHDPSLPLDQPTFQYASLPVSKPIPTEVEVVTEIIEPTVSLEQPMVITTTKTLNSEIQEELFIPDDGTFLMQARNERISQEFIDALVAESFRITGNDHESSSTSGRQEATATYRPRGKITIYDPEYIATSDAHENTKRPIRGVEVRARRWFTVKTGLTDANGVYKCNGEFERDANYSIRWKRRDFVIRKSWLATANLNGPKQSGEWNKHIAGGTQYFYAKIFMAAYHYYHLDIKGLRRPPSAFHLQRRLRIKAEYENNGSLGDHKPYRTILGGNDIKIYNPERSITQIYATTIHEIAHASHWWMDPYNYNRTNRCDETIAGQYCSGDPRVAESWGRGVEWELTRMVWPDYRGGDTEFPDYTQLVVDLIDPNYASSSENKNRGLYNDNVSGYTIRQIEDVLNGNMHWNDWKQSIKNKHINSTENNLDVLFQYWYRN